MASDLEELASKQQRQIWMLQMQEGVSAVLTADPTHPSPLSQGRGSARDFLQLSALPDLGCDGINHSPFAGNRVSGLVTGQACTLRALHSGHTAVMAREFGNADVCAPNESSRADCCSSEDSDSEYKQAPATGFQAVRQAHQLRIKGLEQAHWRQKEAQTDGHRAALQRQVNWAGI